jgi:hypothetical protein
MDYELQVNLRKMEEVCFCAALWSAMLCPFCCMSATMLVLINMIVTCARLNQHRYYMYSSESTSLLHVLVWIRIIVACARLKQHGCYMCSSESRLLIHALVWINIVDTCARLNQHHCCMCSSEATWLLHVLVWISIIVTCARLNQHRYYMCSSESIWLLHVLLWINMVITCARLNQHRWYMRSSESTSLIHALLWIDIVDTCAHTPFAAWVKNKVSLFLGVWVGADLFELTWCGPVWVGADVRGWVDLTSSKDLLNFARSCCPAWPTALVSYKLLTFSMLFSGVRWPWRWLPGVRVPWGLRWLCAEHAAWRLLRRAPLLYGDYACHPWLCCALS